MFWGVTLENGKRYTQVVDASFHVSMAALEVSNGSSKKNSLVSVMIEHEKSEFLLCNLHYEKCLQQPIDLSFVEGEEVTFFINGEGVVHLTGYVQDEGGDQDDYDLDSESENDSEEENEIMTEKKVGKLEKRKPVELQKPPKKRKLEVDSDESDDEEEDDDEEDEMKIRNQQPLLKGKPKTQIANIPPNKLDKPSNDVVKGQKPQTSMDVVSGSPGKKRKKSKPGANASQVQTQKPPQGNTPQSKQENVSKLKQENTPKPKQGSTPKPTSEDNSIKTPESGDVKGSKRKRNKKKKSLDTSTDSQNASPIKSQSQNNQPAKQKIVKGGVVIEDIHVGSGPEATSGKSVSVYYVGRLNNNKEFDSVSGGKPFKFRLGRDEVIKGWDIGLEGMKVGGKRKLIVPPDQGYGNKTVGPIPPHSTLTFEVQLKAVN